MAAVRQVLELDLRKALSDVQTLERDIDDLREPVTIPIDLRGEAVRDIRTIDERLEDIEAGAAEVTRELVGMELAAGRAVADFSRLATELNISEGEAEELTRDILEARNASERTADAARDVARQLGLSEDDARRFAGEVGKGAGRMDELDRETRKVGDSVSQLRSGFGRLVLAAGAFIGIRELGQFAADSIKAFSGLQESTSKANVVFGDFADEVFAFTENAPTQLGNTRQAAIEMAASFGNLFLSVGLGQEAGAEMSTTLVQLGSDLASFNNISVEEALEKLRSGLVGQAEPLRTVGVLLSETAVALKGVELGLGDANGKLSEAEKVQARYAIILEQTVTAQGDFARTSDGIANSSRTVVALFGEFKAKVGEALAPAFAQLTRLAPQIIEGFEGMIPGIAAASLALVEFFTPKPGQADFMDIMNFITDLPRGFGEVFTTVQALGRGVETTAGSLQALFAGDIIGAIRNFNDGLKESADLAQESFERENIQGFIDDLRSGDDAASSLANHLADMGRKGKIDPAFVKNLVAIGGLDLRTAAAGINALLDRAKELGLEADDIYNLRVALAQLASVGESSEADRFMARLAIANKEAAETADRDLVPALERVKIVAGEAGFALADLVTDPLAQDFRDMLTPAEEFQLTLDLIRSGAITAADAFTLNLRPALFDVGRGLQDLNKSGRVSMNEFVTSLGNTAAEFLQFMVDIAAIANISPELALALQQLGPEAAAELASGFASLDPAAIVAAAQAGGLIDTFEKAVLGVYVRGLGQVDGRDPAAVKAYLALIERTFEADIPGITAVMAGAFQPALNASFGDLDPAPLTPMVVASVEGLNQAQITASLNEALDASMADVELADPTNLFLDALDGMDSAALAAAVQEAIFADVRPVIDLSKTTFVGSLPGFGVGGGPGGVGGGVTVVNNIYNPTTTDLPTNTAQANQSTAATAILLNQISGPQ